MNMAVVVVVVVLVAAALLVIAILINNQRLTKTAAMQSSELRQAIFELKEAVRKANESADRIERITKKENQ